MLLFNRLSFAQSDLIPVIQELDGVPFRLVPVIIVARLEDRLSELIAARLPDNSDAKRLAGLEGGRASYGQLVRMASALAIIDWSTRTALDDFGKIRNHFAHQVSPTESDEVLIKPIMRLHARIVAEFVLDLPEEQREEEGQAILARLENDLRHGQSTDLARNLLIGVFKDIWLETVALLHEIESQGRIPAITRPIGRLPGWD